MKFSDLQKGSAKTHDVEVPGCTTKENKPWIVQLTALDVGGETEALAGAREYAATKGVKEAPEVSTLYDVGLMAHTVLLSAKDPDAPGSPAFAALAEVQQLPPDTLLYLFERQEILQKEVSPYVRQMTSEELLAKAAEVAASEDDRPFSNMSPAMRWLFARTMASLWLASRADRSLSSEPSPPRTPETP